VAQHYGKFHHKRSSGGEVEVLVPVGCNPTRYCHDLLGCLTRRSKNGGPYNVQARSLQLLLLDFEVLCTPSIENIPLSNLVYLQVISRGVLQPCPPSCSIASKSVSFGTPGCAPFTRSTGPATEKFTSSTP
jgi:hypothetical protein